MKTAVIVVLLCLCAGVCGCTHGRHAEVLERDHQAMTDQELVEYYFELDEAIDRCKHAGKRGSVGIGTGVGSGGVGFGIGIGKSVGGCDPDQLLEKREKVREEMKDRNIVPAR